MKRLTGFIVVLSLSFFLMACGNAKTNEDKPKKVSPDEDVQIDEKEKIDDDEVVVTINNVDVTGAVYNIIYAQTKMEMQRYEQDVNDLESIKAFTIEALINQEVLRQEAIDIGIDVSDDEVNDELEDIKRENGEQFITMLERYHLTEDQFKDQLFFAIMHDKYVATEISVDEVSNEEVEDIYEELKANNPEVPKIEDVEEQLKDELREQKEQGSLRKKLDTLREESTIKQYI